MTEDELRAIEARATGPVPGECYTNPEADAHLRRVSLEDIPRLAAALREAWADGKRLQDEVAALDAARREAEAAAAAMREALEQQAVQVTDDGDDEAIPVRCLYECALCLAEGPTRKAIVHASSCTLASPTPGAALLAERDRLREALGQIAQRANESGPDPLGYLDTIHAVHGIARAALKETSNG